MPADCPFMAAAGQDDPAGEPKQATGTCSACQLCGAVAPSACVASAGSVVPQTVAPTIVSAFQSALPPLDDKPPIS